MRILAILLLIFVGCKAQNQTESPGLKLLAYSSLPSTLTVNETPFGGLSGMVSLGHDQYLAISDDRSEFAPARMIKLSLRYDGKNLKIEPLSVITLKTEGRNFKFNEIDPEGITKLEDDVVITSEGSYRQTPRYAPFVRRFGMDGIQISEIPFNEERFVPESEGRMTKGVRSNLGFEAVSTSPSGKTLFVSNEAALRQDAPYDYSAQNIVRLMAIDPTGKKDTREYAIKLDFISQDSAATPDQARKTYVGDNGISDMMALSDNEVLILERAWISEVKRQVVRIYSVRLDEKAEVSHVDKLTAQTPTLEKHLVFDFDQTGIALDNLEILCPGPKVDGKETLIVASDNNFSQSQLNQFFLLEILPR